MLSAEERLAIINKKLAAFTEKDTCVAALRKLNPRSRWSVERWAEELSGRRQDLPGDCAVLMSCYWELATLVLERLEVDSAVVETWIVPAVTTAPWLGHVRQAYATALAGLSYDDASTRRSPVTAEIWMRAGLIQVWEACVWPPPEPMVAPATCSAASSPAYASALSRACDLLDDLTLNSSSARRDARVMSLWCRMFTVQTLTNAVGPRAQTSRARIRKRLASSLKCEAEPACCLSVLEKVITGVLGAMEEQTKPSPLDSSEISTPRMILTPKRRRLKSPMPSTSKASRVRKSNVEFVSVPRVEEKENAPGADNREAKPSVDGRETTPRKELQLPVSNADSSALHSPPKTTHSPPKTTHSPPKTTHSPPKTTHSPPKTTHSPAGTAVRVDPSPCAPPPSRDDNCANGATGQQEPSKPDDEHFALQALPVPSAATDAVVVVDGESFVRGELVGRGGQSRVFRVKDASGAEWALKEVMLDRHAPKEQAMYLYRMQLNELQTLQQFKGVDGIIQVRRAEATPSCIRIVMELALGGDLATYTSKVLDRMPRISLDTVVCIAAQLTQTIHACHQARVVHGDVKPANFVLIREETEMAPVLKLIDFGISDEVGGHTTHILRDTMVGSVQYMSPESCQPESVQQSLSRASDVWSLGIILYRIVYGRMHVAASNAAKKKSSLKNPSMMDMVRFLTQTVDPKSVEEEPVQLPPIDRVQAPPDRLDCLRDFIRRCVRWSPAARAKTTDLLSHSLFDKPALNCFRKEHCLHITIPSTGELVLPFEDAAALEAVETAVRAGCWRPTM